MITATHLALIAIINLTIWRQHKMKKTISIIVLVTILSLPSFADNGDGTTGSGGKSCLPGQVCFVQNNEDNEVNTDSKSKFTSFFFDFMESIFR